MPRPKPHKKGRSCLVCGGVTNVAHLGRDICRACTVFYRRSRHRKLTCRSNSNNCPIGDGSSCRRCRLAELERILSGGETSRPKMELENEQILVEKQLESPVDAVRPRENSDIHALLSSPSTSSSVHHNCHCEGETERPRKLLENLRRCYRAMCATRLAGELAHRKVPPHPLEAVEGEFSIIPATYAGMETSHRLYLTALLQFGSSTFPEFANFSNKDRWALVKNCFTRYRIFDSDYRANQAFTDDITKTFAGYTSFFSAEIVKHFFDDHPDLGEFRMEATRAMEANMKKRKGGAREYMRAISLRHEEFLAVLAMMFWDTDGMEFGEEVTQTSKMIREKVLKELHSFYRDEMNLNDYASRLGELLMMLPIYEQRSAGLDQHFEMMRLLNVFTDDTLIYRLK
ncbi:hypothetical protein PMAYCL1PPCAC_17122 [Pristionchus mayeri]|uniref:Nuclear receptor n=1 Tax=Pristionchus mayeri TaxID=1317129 RepID=A0AAN5CM74_9BILA|nr:hypothetical protein PMAYCL1PPCAC_17122 [Pristionchus mayeri]